MLGGNVTVKLGARNQAAPAHGDECDPPVAPLALQGAHGDAKLGSGFGEKQKAHAYSAPAFSAASMAARGVDGFASRTDCGSAQHVIRFSP